MSASNWVKEVFEQGLLGTGATICARVLVPLLTDHWLTDVVIDGFPAAYRKFVGTNAWGGPFFLAGDMSLPFPYGIPVEPP